jgi:hypothetical protein
MIKNIKPISKMLSELIVKFNGREKLERERLESSTIDEHQFKRNL